MPLGLDFTLLLHDYSLQRGPTLLPGIFATVSWSEPGSSGTEGILNLFQRQECFHSHKSINTGGEFKFNYKI